MTGSTDSKEGVLLGNLEQEINKAEHHATSAGTFALRRAQYLNETIKPPLSDDLQLELIRLFREGNTDAKRKILAHNMQLVVTVVKLYSNRGLTLLDLILHGNRGLTHALEEFELNGGVAFPVFAEQCIRQHIERAVMDRNISSSQIVPRAANISRAPVSSMQSVSP